MAGTQPKFYNKTAALQDVFHQREKQQLNLQQLHGGRVLKKVDKNSPLYQYWLKMQEDQKRNDERNYNLLKKFDELEQRTTLMSIRAEKLKILKEQYFLMAKQLYLQRSTHVTQQSSLAHLSRNSDYIEEGQTQKINRFLTPHDTTSNNFYESHITPQKFNSDSIYSATPIDSGLTASRSFSEVEYKKQYSEAAVQTESLNLCNNCRTLTSTNKSFQRAIYVQTGTMQSQNNHAGDFTGLPVCNNQVAPLSASSVVPNISDHANDTTDRENNRSSTNFQTLLAESNSNSVPLNDQRKEVGNTYQPKENQNIEHSNHMQELVLPFGYISEPTLVSNKSETKETVTDNNVSAGQKGILFNAVKHPPLGTLSEVASCNFPQSTTLSNVSSMKSSADDLEKNHALEPSSESLNDHLDNLYLPSTKPENKRQFATSTPMQPSIKSYLAKEDAILVHETSVEQFIGDDGHHSVSSLSSIPTHSEAEGKGHLSPLPIDAVPLEPTKRKNGILEQFVTMPLSTYYSNQSSDPNNENGFHMKDRKHSKGSMDHEFSFLENDNQNSPSCNKDLADENLKNKSLSNFPTQMKDKEEKGLGELKCDVKSSINSNQVKEFHSTSNLDSTESILKKDCDEASEDIIKKAENMSDLKHKEVISEVNNDKDTYVSKQKINEIQETDNKQLVENENDEFEYKNDTVQSQIENKQSEVSNQLAHSDMPEKLFDTEASNEKHSKNKNSGRNQEENSTPSVRSDDSEAFTDSDDSFFDKGLPLTATAAYQSLLGGIAMPQKVLKKQEIIDSESEDDVEKALAAVVKDLPQKASSSVNKKDISSEQKVESLPNKDTSTTPVKLASSRKLSVSATQDKLSKATRKVLGLDPSDSDVELAPAATKQKSESDEDSDEFNFYD